MLAIDIFSSLSHSHLARLVTLRVGNCAHYSQRFTIQLPGLSMALRDQHCTRLSAPADPTLSIVCIMLSGILRGQFAAECRLRTAYHFWNIVLAPLVSPGEDSAAAPPKSHMPR